MSDVRAVLRHDPKTATTIAALRTRIAERISAIVEDLQAIHRTVDDVRPLTHTVEAFEALEAIDVETWEALDALRTIMARSGLLGPDTASTPPRSTGPG